jgi:hypothetical protein
MKTEEFLLSENMKQALASFAGNTFDEVLKALTYLAYAADDINKATTGPCSLP